MMEHQSVNAAGAASEHTVGVRGSFLLFGDAWRLYGKHVKNILLFQLVFLLISIVFTLLFTFLFVRGIGVLPEAFDGGRGADGSFFASSSVLIALFVAVSLLFSAWVGVSQLLYFSGVVHGKPRAIHLAFTDGWKRLLPFLWVGVLQGAVILVGLLLFIVPGIIAMIRLSQAPFLFLTEDVRGRAALRRSMELTRGISWIVLARYYVFGFFVILFGVVQLIPFVGPFLIAPFITSPLLLLWTWLFFNELSQVKHSSSTYTAPYSPGKKAALVLPAFAFAAVFIGIVFLSVLAQRDPSQLRIDDDPFNDDFEAWKQQWGGDLPYDDTLESETLNLERGEGA